MKKLRSTFERFCYRNREKGIPNLMLFVSIGAAVTYLFTYATNNYYLYALLCFDRTMILQGQVWRLISYPLVYGHSNILLTALALFCYYSMGRGIEHAWGTLKFNLFYLSGIVLMDIYGMLTGAFADVTYLNLSLFLSYATLYPDAHFLLFFIIPVKAWILALVDLVLTFIGVFFSIFPHNLVPLLCIGNYLLFFGKDVLTLIPLSWQANFRRLFRKKGSSPEKVIRFPSAGSFEAAAAKPRQAYNHRCTVCGRTDVSDPDLEFRYCSKCSGYHCYCIDHINNHSHIQ